MTTSVFDNPLLSRLFAGEQSRGYFSAGADLRAMLAFEGALARVQGRLGIIPRVSGEHISDAMSGFSPDVASLAKRVADDGVTVPALVWQLRRHVGPDHAPFVHYGATSQDAVDTSLMLRLQAFLAQVSVEIAAVDKALAGLEAGFGARTLMGRTRMQSAIAITVADRIASWRQPLARHATAIDGLRSWALAIQFGGAAGTLETFGDKGVALRKELAGELGLADTAQWHSQRDRIVAMGDCLARLAGSLGKFGQDIGLMAQAGDEIKLSGGGSSSAMAHKQNPVQAEILVTLARFAAGQVALLHQAMLHEQERSGAAWSLEWMVLPQICAAAAASLAKAQALAASITDLGGPADLHA